jgi:2-polyprenyl-3-methyl-5-hydroxy-6-metoxy-1,4-benzoquinol methylase
MQYTFKKIDSCCFCRSSEFKILGKRLNSSQGFFPQKKTGITTTVVKCRNCNLIFSNPMPIPLSIDQHYGVPPEEYWAQEYFKLQENSMDGIIHWINSISKFEKGAKVLDIGAGLGKAMIAMEQKGYEVFGVEPSLSFYNRAIEKMEIKKEKLKLAKIEDCEYEDNSFDFILFSAVLEHLYEPSDMLQKTLKWLKPNGLLFVEVPSSSWLINKIINFAYKIRGKDYVGNLSPMHEPYHLFEFSLKSFQKNAKLFNYEIVDYRYYVCETFMPKFFNPMLKWYMKKTNKGMEIAILLRKKEL